MLNTQILDKLHSDKAWFEGLVKDKQTDFLYSPLSNDEWSLAQVIEHLVIVEQNLASLIAESIGQENNKTVRFNFKKYINKKIVFFILNNGIKVPVPTEAVYPNGSMNIEQSFLAWNQIRVQLDQMSQKINLNPEIANNFTFNHPRIGNLSAKETIEFISVHLRYHLVRVSRLIA